MKKLRHLLPLFAAAVSLVSHPPTTAAQTFDISTANGLFTPSFRDTTNNDLNNSTWWGWSFGSFGTPFTTVNNPAPTVGVGGLDGSIVQTGASPAAIVSGSGNIYTGTNFAETIQFTLPTNGTVGSGFTTIILQGSTAFGGFNNNDPGLFGSIGGATPEVVVTNNALGQGQFWVKYEISGNAATYTMDYTLNGFTSLAGLTVDTFWSATAFAPDIAVIPEPSTALLLLAGLAAPLLRRRARV